jgi:hypothetical protein
MHPTTLRQLLTDPAFAPGRVQDAANACDRWFAADASLAAFVCRSVFRDLIARDFTDPQAVPTADWHRFLADVLPKVVAVLDALPAEPVAELRDLVIGYHSSI